MPTLPGVQPKISVVVPVYNPGEHIDPLIASLDRQTLPQSEFEVVFVDDGSTDETPAKLNGLAAARDNVTVEHIPNSGWPGRPRNIGIDTARGEYIQFMDHDDELGPEALERLYAYARQNGSDVVIGREVRPSGKPIAAALFAKNLPNVRLNSKKLLGIMTPHKLFRREFLTENGIRFHEGPRRMEDHPFVMEAYFKARVISVLADYPVYYWKRRPDRGNAGARPFDWADYYVHMRDVLDVIEQHTQPGTLRDTLLSFYYDSKGLNQISQESAKKSRRQLRNHFDALRALTEERFPPSIDAQLMPVRRIQSQLLRSGDFTRMRALAQAESGLRLRAELEHAEVEEDQLTVRARVKLQYADGSAVRFSPGDDGRVHWEPPFDLGTSVRNEDLDFSRPYEQRRIGLVIRRHDSPISHLVQGRSEPVLDDNGSAVAFAAAFSFPPDTVAHGRPLDPDVYDLSVWATISPWRRVAPLAAPSSLPIREPLTDVHSGRRTLLTFATPRGTIALDVDQQTFPLLEFAAPEAARLEPARDGRATDLHLPLPGLNLSGRTLRGRLHLLDDRGQIVREIPLTVPSRDGMDSTALLADLGADDGENPLPEGQWRLNGGIRGRRADLGLTLVVDSEGRLDLRRG